LLNNDKAVLAQWAKNLLNDDFFKEVIDNLKKEQISVIINTSADELGRREDAYRHIKTIELITGHLEGLASETVIKEKKWKIL
jgi:pyridoxine 5'-phosphate synthase PdxJ